MLRELHITNLAVIADVRIELAAGFNCITGMTGAGKSLVIHAIEALLGWRSTTGLLRPGCQEGRISACFQFADESRYRRIATRLGLTDAGTTGGREIVLSRRIFASGRSTVSANGVALVRGALRQVADDLVDVHGQHDHQLLLRPGHQLDLLDTFAGLESLRASYAEVWARWRAARQRLNELQASERLRRQQLELYRFQADEIDSAGLSPGEHDHWTALARRLGSIERIRAEAATVLSVLDENDPPLVRQVHWAAGILQQLASADAALQPLALSVRDAALTLREAAADLGRYLDRLEADPETLAKAHDRLTVLGKLAAKYAGEGRSRLMAHAAVGPASSPDERACGRARVTHGAEAAVPDDVSAVLAYRKWLSAEIAALEAAEGDAAQLVGEVEQLASAASRLAAELGRRRREAAASLSKAVRASLLDLGMPTARVEVRVRSQPVETGDGDVLGPTGADQVELLVSVNPGLDPAPLRAIASGGELSRVLLAIKGVLAGQARVGTLIFDEIDANIGGRLGSVVGQRLKTLSRYHQVICITHLPQIACLADCHFAVRKLQTAETTETTLSRLEGAQRTAELADMLGVRGPTAATQVLAWLREAADGMAESGCRAAESGCRAEGGVEPVGEQGGAGPWIDGSSSHEAVAAGPRRAGLRVSARPRYRGRKRLQHLRVEHHGRVSA